MIPRDRTDLTDSCLSPEPQRAPPKSTKLERIAQNLDVFDFELTADGLAAIDAIETGERGEPENITLSNFGTPIPEA